MCKLLRFIRRLWPKKNRGRHDIEQMMKSNNYRSEETSSSEVKSSSGSLIHEMKFCKEEQVQEDIQQVDESSVSSERSREILKIQRPDEDKDQMEEFFLEWDEKSLNFSELEDFSFSTFGLKEERQETEDQVREIQPPENEVDQDQQNIKPSDEKPSSLSNCLEDLSFSGVSLTDERPVAEGQISKIQHLDKEEEQDEPEEVQEKVKNIPKEEWKKLLFPIKKDVSSLYKIGKQLGEGGYGSVYEAERRCDGLQVALKYVEKTPRSAYIRIPGHRKDLPSEVAIMMLMQKDYLIPEILQLLEWFEESNRYILVLERPANSEDLGTFTERNGGSLDEDTARIIMRQVVTAAQECCKRGVFHRDIKLENLLVNRTTLQVKLIDFGAGIRLKRGYEKSIVGTEMYFPPEVYIKDKYRGKPATVWSLGILLYRLVVGRFPYAFEMHKMYDATWEVPMFSDELCCLLQYSLQFHDNKRIKMKKMHEHDWFKMQS